MMHDNNLLWLFICSLIATIAVFPKCIQVLRDLNMGQYIQDDGPKHFDKHQTPTSAGIIILVMMNISVWLWGGFQTSEALFIDAVLIGFMLIGLVDDLSKLLYKNNNHGLSPRMKLICQLCLAVFALAGLKMLLKDSLTEIAIPVGGGAFWYIDLGFFYYPFAILAILGASNAFNITDGLDGLATGLTIMVSVGLLVIIYAGQQVALTSQAQHEVGIILVALIGTLTGFLWFNSHPASVFLGDSGSLSLGAGLVYIAMMLKSELIFAIMAGVFIIETISVICQVVYFKRTAGKRLFRMAPLHHHYELCGYKEPKIVMCFWILGLIFLMISICFLL